MSTTAEPAGTGVRDVTFENGTRARLTTADSDNAGNLAARLGLADGGPVIVVFGGAAGLTGAAREHVAKVLAPAVVEAALGTGASIVDGGTAAGVMAAMGREVAARGSRLPLVGVAPDGLVTYPGRPPDGAAGDDLEALEPNHSHFVLAPCVEWGGETRLLLDVAEALAGAAPIVAVVAGGGVVTREETLQAMRRHWPVVVVEATGGTADEIVRGSRVRWPARRAATGILPRRWRAWMKAARRGSVQKADATLAEIVREGTLHMFTGNQPDRLARMLTWQLRDEGVLKLAWSRFARYDTLAKKSRSGFERLQLAILLLAVAATFVALLQHALGGRDDGSRTWLFTALHWTVVALPIGVSVLIATANRLGSGKRWILLRAGAEGIKREIFQYRTKTGRYRPPAEAGAPTRDQVLARRVGAIDQALMRTEVSSGALPEYTGPMPPVMDGVLADDDGLSSLDAKRYLEIRVTNQLSYYRLKTVGLERKLRRLQLLILLAGGAGALVAAAGAELWVGLATAVAAAAAAHLAYLQVESTLVAYNQAAARLDDLQARWLAATSPDPDGRRFGQLVEDAELAVETELSGWVQQMTEALEREGSHSERDDH